MGKAGNPSRRAGAALLALAAGLLASCQPGAGFPPQGAAPLPPPASGTGQGAAAMAGFTLPEGYLPSSPLAESERLSPPPPAPGSAAEARDLEASRAALALRGTRRWKQAAVDADLLPPTVAGVFSCAAGVAIGPATTPAVDRLLRRTLSDLGRSTSAIKKRYQRPRPFMVNGEPTCTPDWEPMLRQDGSYPSGHSAVGYGWGLILAELIPDRAARLVARGRAYGDSRRVCNVHWLSDTEEGRVAAAATVALLHAQPEFRADLDAARAELAGARAAPQGCDEEAAALAPAG